MLAGFYALIELKGWKRWAFPLLVIGANSIAVYVMSWTMEEFVSGARAAPGHRTVPDLRRTIRAGAARVWRMLVFWLILLWMYRRKIFLRI